MIDRRTAAGALAGRMLALAAGVLTGAVAPARAQRPDERPACAPAVGPVRTQPWEIVPLPQSSLVYARDGSLIGEIGTDWRTSVALSTLPRYVPEAFISVEDKRFYEHNGVDLVGIAGALKDVVTEGDVRGASTITQLVVGNLHPEQIDRRDRSIARKLREQAAAREMEKHYNKAQILEAFLNSINFGHRWCGIEEAARHYYGKHASQLTIAEAASLAALPKSPVGYDPVRHPDRNRERRNLILGLMADQGYITRPEAAQAQAEALGTVADAGFSVSAPYFVDAVEQAARAHGVPLRQGGFRIFTTADPALQRDAQRALVD
ncbi:MAG: penicillin-binding protein, partial [Gemmatimonadota bacterium]|nr:penicillin-binding protein [Gemmatimonadota bacterium]